MDPIQTTGEVTVSVFAVKTQNSALTALALGVFFFHPLSFFFPALLQFCYVFFFLSQNFVFESENDKVSFLVIYSDSVQRTNEVLIGVCVCFRFGHAVCVRVCACQHLHLVSACWC